MELNKRGIFWSNTPQGAGIKGAKPGDPDLIICYRGLYVGIEAKAPGGRLRDDQKLRRDQILASGGRFCVPYSVEDVLDFLKELDKELDENLERFEKNVL